MNRPLVVSLCIVALCLLYCGWVWRESGAGELLKATGEFAHAVESAAQELRRPAEPAPVDPEDERLERTREAIREQEARDAGTPTVDWAGLPTVR